MSTLRTNSLEGVDAKNSITIVAGAGNITTTNVQEGLCKAWVHFTQISTQTIRDSFNISSITDTDTGDTTVNINNDFNNNDYACVMYTNTASGEDAGSFANDYLGGLLDRTTGSVGTTSYNGSSPTDASLNDVIFHGDLA